MSKENNICLGCRWMDFKMGNCNTVYCLQYEGRQYRSKCDKFWAEMTPEQWGEIIPYDWKLP